MTRSKPEYGPSKTQQHFEPETNLNTLMKRYQRTKTLPQTQRQPMYGDFTQLPDLGEMQRQMISMNDAFMSLPAKIRKEYDNDPAKFIAAAKRGDKETEELFRKTGLLKEPEIDPKDDPDDPINRIVNGLSEAVKDSQKVE